MPRRETRQDIERALREQRRNRASVRETIERNRLRIEEDLARMRKTLEPAEVERLRKQLDTAFHRSRIGLNRGRRPGDGSMPVLVEPPSGPKPLAGGAAAPLEFD